MQRLLVKLSELSNKDVALINEINKHFKLKKNKKGEIMLFDVTDVEVKDDFKPLPEGEYLVVSDSAEVKETKTGDGKYLKVTFKVLKGEFTNRLVWHQFNFENKNPKAVEIAKQELKKWLTACGIPTEKQKIKSPDAVCGLTCVVRLGTKTDNYGDKNYVKSWKTESSVDEIDQHLGTPTKTKQSSKSLAGF